MAVCWRLDEYSIEAADGACVARLKCAAPEGLDWFTRILEDSFPGCGVEAAGRPRRGGLLELVSVIDIQGKFTATQLRQLDDLLALHAECLTIEDGLDESHALGYHTEEDDLTAGLRRTALGELVYRAKYRSDAQARSQVVDLFGRFVSQHPRYDAAAAVAAVPPHSSSSRPGLSRHLATGLAASGMHVIPIRRVADRPQQKDITAVDRLEGVRLRQRNQRGSMEVPMKLSGEAVIVVDDLYGSGGSTGEAARSLRQAGAGCVLGLAASKQRLFGAVSLGRRGW